MPDPITDGSYVAKVLFSEGDKTVVNPVYEIVVGVIELDPQRRAKPNFLSHVTSHKQMANGFLPLHTPRTDNGALDSSIVKSTSYRNRIINYPPK
jgi:hypothetical protein